MPVEVCDLQGALDGSDEGAFELVAVGDRVLELDVDDPSFGLGGVGTRVDDHVPLSKDSLPPIHEGDVSFGELRVLKDPYVPGEVSRVGVRASILRMVGSPRWALFPERSEKIVLGLDLLLGRLVGLVGQTPLNRRLMAGGRDGDDRGGGYGSDSHQQNNPISRMRKVDDALQPSQSIRPRRARRRKGWSFASGPWRWLRSESVACTMTEMLRDDRLRWGMTEAQAARRFGVPLTTYKRFEAGEQAPNFEVYNRICELFGWPRTFVSSEGEVGEPLLKGSSDPQ